jgi:hypothetical protein
MLSSRPAQFTNDFLPIIFFMDFSQDRLLSTVFAYDNEKKTCSSFTSRHEIGKISDQDYWLLLVRLEKAFVVLSINPKMDEKK